MNVPQIRVWKTANASTTITFLLALALMATRELCATSMPTNAALIRVFTATAPIMWIRSHAHVISAMVGQRVKRIWTNAVQIRVYTVIAHKKDLVPSSALVTVVFRARCVMFLRSSVCTIHILYYSSWHKSIIYVKTVEVLVVGEGREFWYAGCCVSPNTPDENNVSLKHLLSYRARHHDFSSHCNIIVANEPVT